MATTSTTPTTTSPIPSAQSSEQMSFTSGSSYKSEQPPVLAHPKPTSVAHSSLTTSPPPSLAQVQVPEGAFANLALNSPTGSAPFIPNGSQVMSPHTLSSPLSPVSHAGDSAAALLADTEGHEHDGIQRGHLHEAERIIEYGGPNSQYAKLNTILGRGAYKTVWKGLDREEGIEVAWNILETTKNEYSELVQETEILKKVRHPNVIHFYDSWYSNGEFIFITELMTSGTLREYIKKFKNPSMKIIKRWARQILKGLNYLHSQSPPIIHRDIKCDNIFINGSHGEVKIGDMGTAKMKFGKKYTVIGTPEFMAPEMYEEKGYSEKVDIYAFGMCLLEMVTGEYPYNECKNAAQIYKKVSQGIKPECLAKVEDKDVLSIILNCLAPETERWSARKLLEHPFFAEDPDVSLLCVDDTKSKLTIQVVFKGSDKQTVKFDFNTERDTAENVVNEMIEEQILSSKFRQFVTAAIHKILRDLSKNVTEETSSGTGASASSAKSAAPPVPPRLSTAQIAAATSTVGLAKISPVLGEKAMNELHVTQPMPLSVPAPAPQTQPPQAPLQPPVQPPPTQTQTQSQVPTSTPPQASHIVQPSPGLASTTKKTYGPEGINYDFEPMTREYPNDFPIEDFVLDVAISCNRDAEKAKEWLIKLKTQDIMTVGDLRDLLDDDWAHLGLTVFASRALKNGLSSGARKQHSQVMSPRLSVPSSSTSAPVVPNSLKSPTAAAVSPSSEGADIAMLQ